MRNDATRPGSTTAEPLSGGTAALLDPSTADLLCRMPKAESHLHLDGSLRPATALALAQARGIDDGLDLAAMRARLTAPERNADQAELLLAFDLPVRLLQDPAALERVTRELVEDVATDGTRYVEIRWAPGLHVAEGLPLSDGIEAVVRGAESGTEATGVTVRLVAVALRSHPPQMSLAVAHASAAFLDRGLTGFDLAGQEAAFPDPLVHGDAFDAARVAGLGITLHAGEWGGPAQLWRSLALGPQRIAHGSPAADDPDLQRELMARGVTLDLCPTSNVQAGVVEQLSDHPLPRLMRSGVSVTLSTDDRTVSDLTLVEEYGRAVALLGMTLPELWAMDRRALEVAFLHDDEPLRARLLAEFDAFAAGEPALSGAP
ncbi:MAG: adenosine deaminase [Chloroflexota bacterium]|nr:adenosine deaminase [Chloroflexota bacterium]